jgi:hypothetical protein
MNSDRDAHMAEVLAFKCVHAVPGAKPCADFGGLCPFMAPADAYLRDFKTPKCADVTPAMWLTEIRWYREQEAKHGKV